MSRWFGRKNPFEADDRNRIEEVWHVVAAMTNPGFFRGDASKAEPYRATERVLARLHAAYVSRAWRDVLQALEELRGLPIPPRELESLERISVP